MKCEFEFTHEWEKDFELTNEEDFVTRKVETEVYCDFDYELDAYGKKVWFAEIVGWTGEEPDDYEMDRMQEAADLEAESKMQSEDYDEVEACERDW